MKEGFVLMKGMFSLEDNNEIVNDSVAEESEISDDGFFYIVYNGKRYCCINIIGQIEGHHNLSSEIKTTKYEHMIPRLVSVCCDSSVCGILLILNTVGGDIEAGMAMAELISGIKKPVVSIVLGGGHSIGIPLAVSADKSFITESATMTLHPVRTNGLIIGVPQQLAHFQNMQDRIMSFICHRSAIKRERIEQLMLSSGTLVGDFGTVLDGPQAVSEGLINAVGGLYDALIVLDNLSASQT